MGYLRTGAQHSGRSTSLLDLSTDEGGARVACNLLKVRIVSAHSWPRHDYLANVDINVVVIQTQGFKEGRELCGQWYAGFNWDAFWGPWQRTSSKCTLDAEHLQWPRELCDERRKRV